MGDVDETLWHGAFQLNFC